MAKWGKMQWKIKIKRMIPPKLLNNFLLTFPFLYKTKLIMYETSLDDFNGVEELLDQLSGVMTLEGNIMECGSSRCGASIIMANYLKNKGSKKKIFACDSFEGFDLEELREEREKGLTAATPEMGLFTSTSYDYVKKKIKKLKVDDTIVLVKGYFQDTLKHIDSDLCFCLIDCDLSESIKYCAETVWERLVPKGRVVIDDYRAGAYLGAKISVDAFVEKHRNEISEHGCLNRLYYVWKK